MQVGDKNRSTGATLMNQDSSRSHSIFSITIEGMDKNAAANVGGGSGGFLTGKVNDNNEYMRGGFSKGLNVAYQQVCIHSVKSHSIFSITIEEMGSSLGDDSGTSDAAEFWQLCACVLLAGSDTPL